MLYMDDLKLHQLIKIVELFTTDTTMELGLDKCWTLALKMER